MLDLYKKYYFYSEIEEFLRTYTLRSPLIVCACGFEQRSRRFFEILQEHNPQGIVNILIADLRTEASPGDPYYSVAKPMIDANMEKLTSTIKSNGWKHKICSTQFFDGSSRYTAHEEISRQLDQDEEWINSSAVQNIDEILFGRDVILDISSMPRAMVFPLFKKIYNKCIEIRTNFFVSFTEIEPAGSRESQIVSYWRPQWLPGFEPSPKANGKGINVWLPILGFDYRRIREISDRFSFDEIFPVVGFPSVRPLETDSVIKTHKRLFDLYDIPSDNIIFAPIQDPFQLALTLNGFIRDVAASSDDRMRFTVSPLGSKPQSIGACLTALSNPNISMLAVWPSSYEPLPAKSGKSYIYWIMGEIYKRNMR